MADHDQVPLPADRVSTVLVPCSTFKFVWTVNGLFDHLWNVDDSVQGPEFSTDDYTGRIYNWIPELYVGSSDAADGEFRRPLLKLRLILGPNSFSPATASADVHLFDTNGNRSYSATSETVRHRI